MKAQQLFYLITTSIIALDDTAEKLYSQIVPVRFIAETSAYYDAVVAALDGMRLININLVSGNYDAATALDLYKKQMDIINSI